MILSPLQAIEHGFCWLRQRRRLAITLIGLLAFAGDAAVSLRRGIPQPCIHDEFAYLLTADTFAQGRLSNPPHPLWVHFESFHIFHQPTYAAKYPPAQGLILAVGQLLGEHPIVGVWLSVGLMGAALCWMFLAWLPPGWALVGGLLASVQTGVWSYWGQSYWGGAVAATGGALVFGALRRIVVAKPHARDAVLLGVGLAILANSRPYEGLVTSLPAAAVLVGWVVGHNRPATRGLLLRVVLPVGVILSLVWGLKGVYNLRVTGDRFKLPYQVYETTYSPVPLFLWQPLRKVRYRHPVMRNFYNAHLAYYFWRRSIRGFGETTLRRIGGWWRFYIGPALTFPLLVPWLLRDRWMRFALLTCGIVTATDLLGPAGFPHYMAPVTGLVYVLVVQGMRHLHLWRWQGKLVGQVILGVTLIVYLASSLTGFGRYKTGTERSPAMCPDRAGIVTQLKKQGGRHLIMVRYGPRHNAHKEWMYNGADIDAAEVVWAREMKASQNRELITYFADRQVWLLEVNSPNVPPTLMPYPVEEEKRHKG